MRWYMGIHSCSISHASQRISRLPWQTPSPQNKHIKALRQRSIYTCDNFASFQSKPMGHHAAHWEPSAIYPLRVNFALPITRGSTLYHGGNELLQKSDVVRWCNLFPPLYLRGGHYNILTQKHDAKYSVSIQAFFFLHKRALITHCLVLLLFLPLRCTGSRSSPRVY